MLALLGVELLACRVARGVSVVERELLALFSCESGRIRVRLLQLVPN